MKKNFLWLILALMVFSLFTNIRPVSAPAGWLSDFEYRKSHVINSAVDAGINYAVKIVAHYWSNDYDTGENVYLHALSRTDFGDVRFTDEDGSTEFDYWIEKLVEGDYAIFWVEISDASVTRTIYIYYGDSDATTTANCYNTFALGADMDDGSTTGLTLNTAGNGILEVPATASEELYGIRVDGWIKYAGNPVLAKRAGEFDSKGHSEGFSIVVSEETNMIYRDENGKLVAYYTGLDDSDVRRIGLAKSSDDGVTWGERSAPLISPSGQAGSWYKTAVHQPCVVRMANGLLVMVATGWSEELPTPEASLGIFSSFSGTTWTDEGQKIQLSDLHYDNDFGVIAMGVPSFIRRGENDYLMIFEARKDNVANAWRLYLANSTNPTGTWNIMNNGYPVFNETGSGWERDGVADSRIIEVETGKYVMVYSGIGAASSWQIGFASTADFISWTRYGGNPVLSPSGSGSETSHTESFYWVRGDDSNIRLYYLSYDATGAAQVHLAMARQGRVLHGKSAATADGYLWGYDLDEFVDVGFEWEFTIENTADSSDSSSVQAGIFNSSTIPSPMVDTDYDPHQRFWVVRYSPTHANAHKFAILYRHTDDSIKIWDGDSWEAGVTTFGDFGRYIVRIWDDETNYKMNIFCQETGLSITGEISIAKASVKPFTNGGRVAVAGDPFTSHYYLGMNYDYIRIRKYVYPEPSHGAWSQRQEASNLFVFFGVYDESTGDIEAPADRAVNVSVYFSDGTPTETFELNGTVTLNFGATPLYFYYALSNPREYWLSPTETSGTFYIYEDSTTVYTILFVDLVGALQTHPFVEIKRYIDGALTTVEKRKADATNKITASLKQGAKYTLEIKDGISYTFGDVLFTSTTTVTLYLRGTDFPQNIILAYRYYRIWGYRHNTATSISVIFEEVLSRQCNITIDIQFTNHTSVSGIYPYTYTDVTNFNHTWASANFNITYVVQVAISHPNYGTLPYNTVLARGFASPVWAFPLGTIPNLPTAYIIPLFLIFGSFLLFSKINAYLAAFLGVGVAILFTWWNWIPIPATALISALVFAILLAMTHKKKGESI